MATATRHLFALSPPPSQDEGLAGDEGLDVFPLGDLSRLPPDFRAGMEEGEADVLAGHVVTHAVVQRAIEDMRLRRA
jgi:hypothetical protein